MESHNRNFDENESHTVAVITLHIIHVSFEICVLFLPFPNYWWVTQKYNDSIMTSNILSSTIATRSLQYKLMIL